MADGEIEYNDYEGFARAYARRNETNPFNARYERPAILDLAGRVRGLRVLDAGCGSGAHAAELVDRGATVTGVDLSGNLLAIARERLGPRVPLHRADLSRPLPFADGTFDLVLSSLVMHYPADWHPTLREFHRVLVPGGYLGTFSFTEDWAEDGRTMRMRFWHHPLRAMLAAFTGSGFTVDGIVEPDPRPEMADEAPDAYRHLTRKAQFLFFSLTAR